MRSNVAAIVVAMVVAALLTPLVRRLAYRLGAVSRPGGRHVHGRSIPRLGGVAIAIAFCVPLIALFFVDSGVALSFRDKPRLVAGLVTGGLALAAVGVVDDTRGVRALHKLLAQSAVAAAAFLVGFRIESIYVPLLGDLPMGIFAMPVTMIWIVGVTNALNLIDGLDGLAAGVAFFAAFTNFTVAYVSGDVFVACIMAAMMGSLVGFLFYNFNPARIFMGDSGSYFLGYVLATASIAGSSQKASTAVSLLVPIVALGVPIMDTLLSMVRRMLERRPLFSPDRGHIHHRLLDMGITHRRAVMILYGVSILFTAGAIGISLGRSWEVGVALFGVTVVMVGLARFVGYFEYLHLRRRQKARLYDKHTERLRRILPGLHEKFLATSCEDEVWGVLGYVAETAELSYLEIRAGEQIVHRWGEAAEEGRLELVSARYPLGRDGVAKAELEVAWQGENEDVAPQMDILLQITVDLTEAALRRLGSRWVPRPSISEGGPAAAASPVGLADGAEAAATVGRE